MLYRSAHCTDKTSACCPVASRMLHGSVASRMLHGSWLRGACRCCNRMVPVASDTYVAAAVCSGGRCIERCMLQRLLQQHHVEPNRVDRNLLDDLRAVRPTETHHCNGSKTCCRSTALAKPFRFETDCALIGGTTLPHPSAHSAGLPASTCHRHSPPSHVVCRMLHVATLCVASSMLHVACRVRQRSAFGVRSCGFHLAPFPLSTVPT